MKIEPWAYAWQVQLSADAPAVAKAILDYMDGVTPPWSYHYDAADNVVWVGVNDHRPVMGVNRFLLELKRKGER